MTAGSRGWRRSSIVTSGAVERLCAALPELIPPHTAALTHGGLWIGNILADDAGRPSLIDPVVSYTWPEIDLAMLWVQRRPPAAARFFAVYEELAHPFAGWRIRGSSCASGPVQRGRARPRQLGAPRVW
jgi:fructosamine-3-kinase